MISVIPKNSDDPVVFSSSLSDDRWHQLLDPKSYELWYFDALSDDQSELVSITFLDNFVFSSRYNERITDDLEKQHFPAVTFQYSKGGELLYASQSEFDPSDFSASTGSPECSIGGSFFRYQEAEYGSGFSVAVTAQLSNSRQLEAHFEWLSVEADLLSIEAALDRKHHFWNVVAPRSDVTGRITVRNRSGEVEDIRHFRGTGYHDHKIDNRWFSHTVAKWYWGRAHFADATAVFCRYREKDDSSSSNKLLIVRDGNLEITDAHYSSDRSNQDFNSPKHPSALWLTTPQDRTLEVRPTVLIHSTFFLQRWLCDAILTLDDNVERRTTGVVDFLVPEALSNRWLNWRNTL